MKEIELPIGRTVSITLTAEDLNGGGTVEIVNGCHMVSLGRMIDDTITLKIDTAKKNGGKILYATQSIEQQLESILLIYFMGPFISYSQNREMFENEILQSSALTFSKKKELVSKIINEKQLLDGKRKSKVQSLLKKIMEWRNAFAHGQVKHNNIKGCFVRHYSGEQKKLYLTEEYWLEVENCFKECSELLKYTLQKLQNI